MTEKEVREENTDLKKRLKESESLRKDLVKSLSEAVLHDHALNERVELYQEMVDIARTVRSEDNGTISVPNLLSFFEALDKIPVPS